MKFQYEPPKLTLGVVMGVAIVLPVLLGYFLITGFAQNACYEGLCTTTTTATSSGPAVLTGTVIVSMPAGAGNGPSGAPGFAPDNITIAAGTTVMWENNDTVAHTATSASGNGTVNSGNMNPGATYSFTFTTPGTYNIVCTYHYWMKQQIKVVPASTAPAVFKVSMPAGAGTGPSAAPGFSPDKLSVPAGSTVIWTNNDTVAHTVTSVSGNGSLNSGNMNPGASYNFTFTTPGTYDYICTYHYWMTGTVVVTPAVSTSSGPSVIQVKIPAGAGNGPSSAPGFSPDTIKVVLGVNSTVNWTNDDTVAHTVTSVSGNGSLSSGNMNAGANYTYTFTTAGTYDYICTYHYWMTGTVVVVSLNHASPPPATSTTSSSTSSTTSTAGSSLNAVQVSIPNGSGSPSGAPGFAPDNFTVVIGVNNTVTWTNNDSTASHTVQSSSVPIGATAFNSGNMVQGATFTYTFTVPGTYDYYCAYHSWMKGVITVING